MDLARALTDAADRATDGRDPIPATPLLPRIHRRRALRRGGDALAGVAAVGLVALAVVTLGGGRATPPPPAVTTSAPAPSPSTSAATRPWPAAVTAAAVPACGERLPAIQMPTDAVISASVQAPTLALPADRVSPVTLGDVRPEDFTAPKAAATQLVLVKDGAVVSRVAEVPAGADGAATYAFVGCDGSTPVPAGDYQLYAFATLSGDTKGAGLPYPGELVVTGAPVPLTLTEAVGAVQGNDLAACGTRPTPASDDRLWVGDYAGGMDGDVGTPLDLDWSVITNDDLSGRPLTATILHLWLLDESGTVVAVPSAPVPATASLPMTSGSEGGGSGSEGQLLAAGTTFVACPGGSGSLPAGVYLTEVEVRIDGGPAPMRTSGGELLFLPSYDAARHPATPPRADLITLDAAGASTPLSMSLQVGNAISRAEPFPGLAYSPGTCTGGPGSGWTSVYPAGQGFVPWVSPGTDAWQPGIDTLTRIDVVARGPHLASGIQVGSTLAQLRAAEPGTVVLGTTSAGTTLVHVPRVPPEGGVPGPGWILVELTGSAPSDTVVAISVATTPGADATTPPTAVPAGWVPASQVTPCG